MISSAPASSPVEQASQPYLGRWNRLVSTTNWEKGRIIHEWRLTLVAAGAEPAEYADDAWSSRVGNVSGQHVGRLRRVYDRFGAQHEEYAGLFWSHFQAALDWNDAEMWLEGAVQSEWSISEMRRQRWQALGAPANLKPRDEDIIVAELDEDSAADGVGALKMSDEPVGLVRSPASRNRAAEDDTEAFNREAAALAEAPWESGEGAVSHAPSAPAPFAQLPELPDDLAEAFESFKLAILRHKLAGWTEISRTDVLDALDSLKQLAIAPS